MVARTVFLGSGSFAVPILEGIARSPLADLRAVVSAPARPVGRRAVPTPTPVDVRATELGIRVLRPSRLRAPEAVADLAAEAPELLVLADYGQLVPREVLDIPRHGALNLHPSLLPRHRGAAPVAAAILAGDPETGVTLMRMDAGLDTGPIVAQARLALTGDEDAPALEGRLAQMAATLLLESLPGWLSGDLGAVPQPVGGATLTRPFRREDGRLDPSLTAVELERRVRALRPWPGTFLERPEGRLIVHQVALGAEVAPGAGGVPPGTIPGDLVAMGEGKGLRLGLVTGDELLVLSEVQPQGKGRMSGADLVRGRPGWLARGEGR